MFESITKPVLYSETEIQKVILLFDKDEQEAEMLQHLGKATILAKIRTTGGVVCLVHNPGGYIS